MTTTEICDECKKPKSNVGNWEDGRRLCGGCKIRTCLRRPGFKDLRAALLADEQAGTP